MHALVVDSLSVAFPDGTRALRAVSFALDGGERGLVAGPNGAGKTVLGLAIAGLLETLTGTISVDGKPPGFRSDVEAPVAAVFQNPDSQIVGQTVWEDVLFGPENLGVPAAEATQRAEAALDAMGLVERRNHDPMQLSGGERRRLAIAGALALKPRLLFLDEPFAGLDYPSIRRLLSALEAPAVRSLPLLVATHDIDKFSQHADRLLVLQEGCLAFDGSVAAGASRFATWGLAPLEPA